ncbi:MAG: CRISPR system precrRNA processing endoribonuclease RAMP protein Cas6 [Candidatus Brocadia sp. AMX2]|nr:MAG: CRISPR system precrRNA processing endoribonuclease RAMP protein Cas6 [Candidatus Brocadia sp. AMX2]MBC6933760.1 CRISPR system precrRNA processing endoribonuclease RAMP protein Cas6 [Candidatus Brocadia sp.]MBL1170125.1 CRISPR system precrRNA processing endoribonuclease RAMP protein Cas6 [Candidatus Brocadia sp. AMX1]MCE7868167.1 CRISPR system precrRNA processing endoribonuclease RAMP protein Cas6 [Candidatus Brocadia sp. AMX2]MCQ3918277.1 hypothetical protein [Candidatus Brocadia sp.]
MRHETPMDSPYPHPFSGLRWHRLSVTVMNIRSLPAMCAHPFSVFQAIIKGVSLPLSSRPSAASSHNLETQVAPVHPDPPPMMVREFANSSADISPVPGEKAIGDEETERSEMAGEKFQAARLAAGNTHEPLIIFHARGRKHSFKMREYDKISLEIYFFRKGIEYVRQWRNAFQSYLSDPVTGRNFEIVEMAEAEERSIGQVASEMDIQHTEEEICLEFLTPLPFKPGKGKPRTYIAKTSFIRSLERRFSRLFGREIVYHSQDDRFSILPYYWNYTEIRHASVSQPGQTQYINGCVGKLYIKGNFKDFLPFLLLGSEVHIGAKLSNSQGYYLMHKESPGYFNSLHLR